MFHYGKKIKKSKVNKQLLSDIYNNGFYEIYSNKNYILLNCHTLISMSCFTAKKNTSCKNGWKISNSKVGEGAFGKTFLACCDLKCDYIAKYVIYRTPEDILLSKGMPLEEAKNLFQKEVDLQKLASTKDLSPIIYDSWPCESGGVIIMEPMKMTLGAFLKECLDEKHDPEYILVMIKWLVSSYIELLKLQICHGDLHLDNIMLSFDKKEDIYIGNFKMKFIDFGQSQYIKDKCFDFVVTYSALYKIFQDANNSNKNGKIRFFLSYSLNYMFDNIKILKSAGKERVYMDSYYLSKYHMPEKLKENDEFENAIYESYRQLHEDPSDSDLFGDELEDMEILKKTHNIKI